MSSLDEVMEIFQETLLVGDAHIGLLETLRNENAVDDALWDLLYDTRQILISVQRMQMTCIRSINQVK